MYAALNCAGCHGKDAKSGPAGKNLPATDPAKIAKILREGQGRMPKFDPDKLPDTALTDLIAYLQSLRCPRTRPS